MAKYDLKEADFEESKATGKEAHTAYLMKESKAIPKAVSPTNSQITISFTLKCIIFPISR